MKQEETDMTEPYAPTYAEKLLYIVSAGMRNLHPDDLLGRLHDIGPDTDWACMSTPALIEAVMQYVRGRRIGDIVHLALGTDTDGEPKILATVEAGFLDRDDATLEDVEMSALTGWVPDTADELFGE